MERSSRYVYNIMYTHIHSHLQGTTPSSSSHSSDKLTLSEVHTPHTLHTTTLSFFTQSTVKMKPLWQAYIVELVVVLCMGLYLLNYFIGRSRNSSLAYSWCVCMCVWDCCVICVHRLSAHRDLLDSNFALVGKCNVLMCNVIVCPR